MSKTKSAPFVLSSIMCLQNSYLKYTMGKSVGLSSKNLDFWYQNYGLKM